MAFKKLKEKRGGTLVEAAFVWPFVIFSLIAVLTMAMSLFSEGVILASSHMSLRETAGRWTQTVGMSQESMQSSEILSSKNVPKELELREEFWMQKNRVPMATTLVEGAFVFLPVYPRLSLKVQKNYGGFGLLHRVWRTQTVTRYQCMDEAQFVRNLDYAIELAGKEGGR